MSSSRSFLIQAARGCLIGLGLWLSLCSGAGASVTDIGNAPLFTSSSNAVKPNIMFILDDSGSMKNDYLPDVSNFAATKYGKKTSQCNGVAYNPNVNYTLPVDKDGVALTAGSTSAVVANPVTQTSNQKTLSALAVTPSAATGTMAVVVTSGSRRTGWYDVGDTVTVFQNGDTTRYITGFVKSWNSSTGAMVIDLAGGKVVGSGAMSDPRIGDGQPNDSVYYKYTGSQPRLSYTYTSSGVITTTTFYLECTSNIGSNPGAGVFTAVTVGISSTEVQNYANWYQYYRNRMLLMKSSISLAFKSIDTRYRVGYSTISETNATEGTDFLNVRDFDTTQKGNFYTAFNAATPSSYTPLRGALSKAGQYYANKARGQTIDPIQYSCQRNFTILSTDGYWNTDDESTSSPKYGPYQMDNSTLVGQQDGSGTLNPMLDGNSVSTTTTETWTTSVGTVTTVITPKITVSGSTRGTVTSTPTTGYTRYQYTLPAASNVTVVRPTSSSPFWITVTTSANHNLSDGNSVQMTVSGGGITGYTGTVVVDVIDSTHFRYTPTFASPARPNSPSGTYSMKACGVQRQLQTQDVVSSSTTTYNSTTTTFSTITAVTTAVTSTPHHRTIIVIDNVTQSDTGDIAGTLSSTSSTITSTVTLSVASLTTSTVASGTSTTSWVNSGSPVYTGGCGATLPTPNPSTPIAGATTTSATSVNTGPTSSGPTTTPGTSTSTFAPTSSTSAHVSVSSSISTGGTPDSLADVAAYYYNTDLRDTVNANCTGALGTDICTNNVKGATGDAKHSYGDAANWQHMTTFTLGLGVGGILSYDPAYQTLATGDFHLIATNQKNWPVPGPSKGPENTDDLWHAAVNGRGQYFSAGDPASLASSLNSALNAIKAITGAASAASTSSLQPVEGDNDIYLAKFTTEKWIGDIEAYKIDPSTGAISAGTTWKAAALLDQLAEADRKIYYPAASGGALNTFTYANLTTDLHAAKFDGFCTKTGAAGSGAPAQCASLTPTQLAAANVGDNLVSYLRGKQSLAYYRSRDSVLGDIINASPLFIGKPSFKYTENSYPTFAATTRTAVVLAASNDGMLHAFDRLTGTERWAFIPSFVLGSLYKLADTNYSSNHSYFVDGSPQLGDIYVGGAWKSIVVGGLNAGGRGYYALDVTNPAAPKLLWEFSADDLGLTFGNPIITKRSDGTWVVVFSSGYNNVSPGDGNGHLFVVNANTGVEIKKVSTFTTGTTAAGSSTTPSGLGKINSWVDSELNNHALRFYGGDLLGNLWRFDIDDIVAPNSKALRLAELKLSSGAVQSITVKPALGEITYNSIKYPVVYVATGRYLGTTDVSNTTTQAVYAFKDPLTDTSYGNIRTSGNLVTQTISLGTATRSVTTAAVNWATNNGWRADFPVAGERVNINPQLILSTLYVGTNTPDSNVCSSGGSSFLYKFDITTGGVAQGESNIGTSIGQVLLQGITTVQLAGTGSSPGSIVTILTKSDGTLEPRVESTSSAGGVLRRSSWRELLD